MPFAFPSLTMLYAYRPAVNQLPDEHRKLRALARGVRCFDRKGDLAGQTTAGDQLEQAPGVEERSADGTGCCRDRRRVL